MNQVDLARESGVPQTLISSYLRESAKAKYPSLSNLIALKAALGCSLEELTGVEDANRSQEVCEETGPSEEQTALWKAYQKLPDGHWLKIMIQQELLGPDDT